MTAAWNPETLCVLVADDQPTFRSMLKKMLKDMKIDQVFEAGSGREALRLIDSAPDIVDMILCDWNMPGMSGVELLRQVRSVGLNVPFLLITGRADRESVIAARDAGVTAFIAKPFSSTQLEAKMRLAIERRA